MTGATGERPGELRSPTYGIQWENGYPKGKNQATNPSREGGGVGGLHCGGRVFTIHNYSSSTVATHSQSRIIHSAPKDEIPD